MVTYLQTFFSSRPIQKKATTRSRPLLNVFLFDEPGSSLLAHHITHGADLCWFPVGGWRDDALARRGEFLARLASNSRPTYQSFRIVLIFITPVFADDNRRIGIVRVIRYRLNAPLGVISTLLIVRAIEGNESRARPVRSVTGKATD